MKKYAIEDIGLEATLPVEITQLLNNHTAMSDCQNMHTESNTNNDLFLDEYELAMIL